MKSNCVLRTSALLCIVLIAISSASGQELASFSTADGGRIEADIYGRGTNAVILAHGGRFDKESWEVQARALAEAGFLVLALNFRGYGDSSGPSDSDSLAAPLHLDILGAAQYLRASGADKIGIVGGSLGGSAAAEAAAASNANEISSLILLASGAGESPESIQVPTLFIVARDDLQFDGTPRRIGIRQDYEKVQAPKEFLLLEGSEHAQYLFDTPQAEQVMAAILSFLSRH